MSFLVGKYLTITLATQFLQTCSDRHEIIGGAGSGRHVSSALFVVTGCRHYSWMKSANPTRGRSTTSSTTG
jgi:hypothetical protein